MRLTPSQVKQTAQVTAPDASSHDAPPEPMLTHALEYARAGWNVFPLRPGRKIPLFPRAHDKGSPRCSGDCGKDGHGCLDGTTDEAKIRRWWAAHPNAGIGANLGTDKVAFDLDLQHGGRVLESFPTTRTHYSGRDNGNRHLIYDTSQSPAAQALKSATAVLGEGMDVRIGVGGYIVLPPTPHEDTNKPYRVGPEHGGVVHPITDEELQAIFDEAGVALSASARGASRGLALVSGRKATPKANKGQMGATKTLSALLLDPPTRGEGRTNDWLARVAGHYAKMHRPDKRDLFEVEVRRAAAMVKGEPYPSAEIDKTIDSIWSTEVSGHAERDATAETGWLVGDGRNLFCRTMVRTEDGSRPDMAPYADFDIEARGVTVDDTYRRAYWVRVHWNHQEIDLALDGETLGDDRALRKWLATIGATIDTPAEAFPKTAPGTRIQRYLNSQNPPEVHIATTLGWHAEISDGVYVTHDGVITPDGPTPSEQAGVVADPRLVERDVAPYHYGFEDDEATARAVLAEVQTFHDETVTAVFGSWWAACLLKPQIQEHVSMFPFFGVEGASESGKTTGYFAHMAQLNGNTRGGLVATRPVLRDSASAHRSGIVWADDLDDLAAYGEILRASTSNGTASKMDMDRSAVKNTQIVAPILITGEQLGFGSQKALVDRAVLLQPPSPTSRRSARDPNRLQWEDILELEARYPKPNGLAALSGWLVKRALAWAPRVVKVLQEHRGGGRAGDKVAVLVAGARLLDALCATSPKAEEDAWAGRGENARKVTTWTGRYQGGLTADNTATLRVVPWALRQFKGPEGVEATTMGRFDGVDTPVIVRPPTEQGILEETVPSVWVSVPNLAAAWAREHNHRIDLRTETETALKDQLDRVTVTGASKTFRVSGTRRTVRMRRLQDDYARLVLERAEIEF